MSATGSIADRQLLEQRGQQAAIFSTLGNQSGNAIPGSVERAPDASRKGSDTMVVAKAMIDKQRVAVSRYVSRKVSQWVCNKPQKTGVFREWSGRQDSRHRGSRLVNQLDSRPEHRAHEKQRITITQNLRTPRNPFTAKQQVIEIIRAKNALVYSKNRSFLPLPGAWEASALPLSYTRIRRGRRAARRRGARLP